ncbi:coiled-coil domain-containing protein 96 [Cynocephalus volans]|uniref:coiled-coil domain-containing protein 96 n=1 Tax=Cynocephalus volans TaxID=110931 RepID=UPI002FC680BD
MDGQSEHTGGSEGDGGDEGGLASRPSESKASSGPQSPAEPAEPEPDREPEREPEAEKVEASEGGAAADAQAGTPEGPAATETAGEGGSGAPGRPSEPGETAEAGDEELAKPEPEAGPQEPGAAAEEEQEEGETREAPSRASLPLSTAGGEKAAPGREAERESAEGEDEGAEARAATSGERRQSPGEEDLEWTAEVRRLQEQQLRSELLEQYRSLLVERSRYQRYNVYLQHQIVEALRKKKGLDAAEVPDKGVEAEAPEKEQAYLGYLAVLEELRKQQADDLAWYHQELDQLKQQCQEKLARVEKEWRGFQALKKQVVMQAMGSCRMRGGRQAALREVEQIQALEDKKEKEMSAVRLENVQLKQSLVHFETRMKAQEELSEGLLFIDFEQLKIENQTFNEKAEERNEELLKLRNKVTNNVQIVTHVKEKLHFMDMENACKKAQLSEIESQVALGRDILTKTKKARDSLRIDNIRLNQKCGLLGKESLLRDLEEKVEKAELLSRRLESLKRHHAGLTLSCRGVKQKIREAKAFLPS